MEAQAFEEVLRQNAWLQFVVVNQLCEMQRVANERVASLALQTVTERVRAFDAYWRRVTAGILPPHVRLSMGDIAAFVGASRESVHRAARQGAIPGREIRGLEPQEGSPVLEPEELDMLDLPLMGAASLPPAVTSHALA